MRGRHRPARGLDVECVGGLTLLAEETADGGMLFSVDVADPAGPREVGHLEGMRLAWRLAAHDGLVYILDRDEYESTGLCGSSGNVWIVDVRDPGRPRKIAVLDVPAVDVGATDDRLYALLHGSRDGLEIYDLSDPAAPRLLSSGDYVYGCRIALAGQRAYVHNYPDPVVSVYDVADPARLARSTTIAVESGWIPVDLCIRASGAEDVGLPTALLVFGSSLPALGYAPF